MSPCTPGLRASLKLPGHLSTSLLRLSRAGVGDDGPHINTLIEPKVHVVNLRDAIPQRARQIQIPVDTFEKLVVSEAQERGIPFE
jgi:hypothetical protein